jgi:hypothetical protein
MTKKERIGPPKSLRDLRPGDEVFVVWGRRYEPDNKIRETISRVGREYGYIQKWRQDYRFSLDTGRSVDQKNSNARVNGRGFEVYLTEEAYRKKEYAEAEVKRLAGRLGFGHTFGYSDAQRVFGRLHPDTISAIHAQLDLDETRKEKGI